MDPRASPTSADPASTFATLSAISNLISRAACALRCARLRTSEATTAKPRPCSPARAASTAALSASRLVWKAMPSITPTMSAILRELALISSIVDTTRATASLPRVAASDAPPASCVAALAVAALCLTVAVSCSMEAAVCCRLLACSSVRWLRSALPVAIWDEPVPIESELSRTWLTMVASPAFIFLSEASSCAVSSLPSTRISDVRSPAATRSATLTATRIGPVMERVIDQASSAPMATAAATRPRTARWVCA